VRILGFSGDCFKREEVWAKGSFSGSYMNIFLTDFSGEGISSSSSLITSTSISEGAWLSCEKCW